MDAHRSPSRPFPLRVPCPPSAHPPATILAKCGMKRRLFIFNSSSPQAQDHYPQQTLPLKQQSFVLGTVVNAVIHRSQAHCRRFDDVGQCTDKACRRIAGILHGNLSGSSFSCAWVYQLVILSQSGTGRRRQLELMAIYAVLQTRDDSNCWQEIGVRWQINHHDSLDR